MQIFDSHAHYNDEKFELDREEILQMIRWLCPQRQARGFPIHPK